MPAMKSAQAQRQRVLARTPHPPWPPAVPRIGTAHVPEVQRQGCACGGGCQRCQSALPSTGPITKAAGPVVARDPKPDAPPADKVHRDAVKATIATFTSEASTIGGAQGKVDTTSFEASINGWYAKVTEAQQLIKDKLGGDVLLDRDLQAAYISAIRALMPKAATALTTTEDALYRTNTGRIPMWAWQSAHRQESGISTPLDQGQAVDPLSGEVAFAAGGTNVKILPDSVDPALKTPTTQLLIPVDIPFTTVISGKTETIDGFTPPANLATIQTSYPPGVPGSGASGYGRGTTAEDIAGGKVNPQSTTLRWHEGTHGLDYVAYLKANPLPTFNGTTGMTRAKFAAEIATYKAAVKAYATKAEKASDKLTHCVGTTIDAYNQANAKPGTKVKLECTP